MDAVPVKATAVVCCPAQSVCEAIGLTVGIFPTVKVNIAGVPKHVPIEGVTVTVEVVEAAVEFVAVNEGMSPFPDAANPVAVLSFVQSYEVPVVPTKVTVVVA